MICQIKYYYHKHEMKWNESYEMRETNSHREGGPLHRPGSAFSTLQVTAHTHYKIPSLHIHIYYFRTIIILKYYLFIWQTSISRADDPPIVNFSIRRLRVADTRFSLLILSLEDTPVVIRSMSIVPIHKSNFIPQ